MYNGQIFVQKIFPRRPHYVPINLNNLKLQYRVIKYAQSIKNKFMQINMFELTTKVFCENRYFLNMMKYKIDSLPNKLKSQSVICVKTWTRQCGCVSAQQLRRSQQMCSLYMKLWEERALREFIKLMRQQIFRRGKHFIIGAIGMSVYDWGAYRIADQEIMKHIQDFEYIEMLKNDDLNCKCCNKRKLIDFADPNVAYCKCPGDKDGKNYKDNWEPYLERTNIKVWRRQRTNGCFEYIVYGTYDDVTAMDFLDVQIDIEYRRKWDTTAVSLEIIESEPDTNSDIVYWEMLWPRLFTNRDYVFNRRYLIREEENVLLLCSQGTEHPSCPAKSDKYRIKDYFSCMVIKPTTKMDQPGIEFALSYFDNPGVNIPAAVTSWVAMAAMPDFLEKLRTAAKDYKEYCIKMGKFKADPNLPSTPPQLLCNDIIVETDNSKSSYWRYLHPHYYFG